MQSALHLQNLKSVFQMTALNCLGQICVVSMFSPGFCMFLQPFFWPQQEQRNIGSASFPGLGSDKLRIFAGRWGFASTKKQRAKKKAESMSRYLAPHIQQHIPILKLLVLLNCKCSQSLPKQRTMCHLLTLPLLIPLKLKKKESVSDSYLGTKRFSATIYGCRLRDNLVFMHRQVQIHLHTPILFAPRKTKQYVSCTGTTMRSTIR